MLSAKLVINVGDDAKQYVKVIGKGEHFKRGSVSFSAKKGTIEIIVKASDAAAILASLNSALKQLRIVNSVSSIVK